MRYDKVYPLSLRRTEGLVFWTFLLSLGLLAWSSFFSHQRDLASVVQSLSASYIAGVAFWFLCIWNTERKERRIIQNHLREYYRLLKRNLIGEVLRVLKGTYDPNSDEVKQLMSPIRFREFATEKRIDGTSNWDTVLSEWEVNQTCLKDVRVHLLGFVKASELVLTRLNFTNEKAFREMWYACHHIREVLCLSIYDQGTPAKYIGKELVFPRLAAWHSSIGYIENGVDWLETAIDNIYTPFAKRFPWIFRLYCTLFGDCSETKGSRS